MAKASDMFVKIKIDVNGNAKEFNAVRLSFKFLISHFKLQIDGPPSRSQTKTLELVRVCLV